MNISIKTDNIANFVGDVMIIPCDTELTYSKAIAPNSNYPLFKHESNKVLVKVLFEKAGKGIVSELSAVGYCEIGNAVSVQGYDLKVKRVIFMPIADHNNPEVRINYIGLHQSLKAAFTLAELYKSKSIAIGNIRLPFRKRNILLNLWNRFINEKPNPQTLNQDEIEDIIISTSKASESTSIKDIFIYK